MISAVFVSTFFVVFTTSALSGVLGMGGGMILMAFLAAVFPITTAMIVHGTVQAVANGSRCLLLWRHVAWKVLPSFIAGIAVAVTLFSLLTITTEKWIVLIMIGLLPFTPKVILTKAGLDVTRPLQAFICGLIVTIMQLFAGASGPLLDIFFQNTSLNRHQIIATKALTQTIGHLIKVMFYSSIVGTGDFFSQHAFLVIVLVISALIGTKIGTVILEKMQEETFRKFFRTGIRIVGLICIGQGLWAVMVLYQ